MNNAVHTGIKIVAGVGVGKVIDDLIGNFLPTEVKPLVKVAYKIGAFVISWVAADWFAEKFDEDVVVLEQTVHHIKLRVAEVKEEMEKNTEASEDEAVEVEG